MPALPRRDPGGTGRGAEPSRFHAGRRAAGRQGRSRRQTVRRSRVLDSALKDAGISREDTYVTNAVKHFKHEMRGKRRLHKRPNNYEIERCKIWLEHERDLVKPSTIIALGVTAARSVTGKTVTISKMRRTPVDLADGSKLVVTVHPSALLRIEDEKDKHAAYRDFVADLKTARLAAAKAAAPKR
jgi:uracil-DNA glycosylase family protein